MRSNYEYDYFKNGHDWPDKYEECQRGDQSPIDLQIKKAKKRYETDSGYEFYRNYQNIRQGYVEWIP